MISSRVVFCIVGLLVVPVPAFAKCELKDTKQQQQCLEKEKQAAQAAQQAKPAPPLTPAAKPAVQPSTQQPLTGAGSVAPAVAKSNLQSSASIPQPLSPTSASPSNLKTGAGSLAPTGTSSSPVLPASKTNSQALAKWQIDIRDKVLAKVGSADDVGGQCNPKGKYTFCYAWARKYVGISAGSPTAKDGADYLAKAYPARYKKSSNFSDAPVGALVLFDRHPRNGNSGHASIKVNDTEMVNEGFGELGVDACRVTKNKSSDEPGAMIGYYAPE